MENLLSQPQYKNHLITIIINTDANNQYDWYNEISEVLIPMLLFIVVNQEMNIWEFAV